MVSGGWWTGRGGEAPIGVCRHPTASEASVPQAAGVEQHPTKQQSIDPSLPEAWEAALACVGGWVGCVVRHI